MVAMARRAGITLGHMDPSAVFDLRTRVDEPDRAVRPPRHWVDQLTERAAGVGWLGDAAAAYELGPLTIRVDGDPWAFSIQDGRLVIGHGDGAPGVDADRWPIDMSEADFDDFALDSVTPIGWFSSGHLPLGRSLGRMLDWALVFRGLWDDEVPYLPGSLVIADPAEWMRSFRMGEDSTEAMRDFLATYGFLHLQGLFSAADMAAVSADMDTMAPRFAPGDGQSWWATDSNGTQHLVRAKSADEHSATVAELVARPEFLAIGDITGCGHRWNDRDANRIEALTKPLNIVEGISDVPWHKDCSLGRHSYMCCRLTVGVSVTPGATDTGLLRVVAGSHRARTWPALSRPGLDLPVVPLPTEAGDVTVHLSCTLHEALPPTTAPRRVMYTDFVMPALPGGSLYDTRLRVIRDQAAVTVSQPAAMSERPSF